MGIYNLVCFAISISRMQGSQGSRVGSMGLHGGVNPAQTTGFRCRDKCRCYILKTEIGLFIDKIWYYSDSCK